MAGLCASGLHSGETVVVSRDGVVVLNALLGTALLVDFHKGERRRVILHQPHLRRHCHHPGHCRHRERGRQVRRNVWRNKEKDIQIRRKGKSG